MKILTVVGARPQFIKASAVSAAIRAKTGLREILVHTGQHYDAGMSEVFFQELGMAAPAHHLGVGSGSHAAQTARMLEPLEALCLREAPDWVLIYGDTNSTLAGALVAAKLNLPLAHVEAGMRAFRRDIPEEINRVVADGLSTLLLTPTVQGRENLIREGHRAEDVVLVGDVMLDVAMAQGERADARGALLEKLRLQGTDFALATIHRAENTDNLDRLNTVLDALGRVSREMPVVFPAHPRTRQAATAAGMHFEDHPRFHWIDPVGYLDMVMLERRARVVITDSGGVQKEAYFHKRPCVTLRTATEWPELIEAGWNRLADPAIGAPALVNAIRSAWMAPLPMWTPLYGDGRAADAIVRELVTRKGAAAR